MEAEPFRLIIVVLALIWTVALVLLFVMTFVLYRRMSAMRASIQRAVAETKEAAKPIMQIAAIIEVVKSGVDLVRRMSEIRKGGKQE
jgi:flagellar biosynthesis/type III secretory pathway M-ring protein FliF/YscJ